MSETIPWLDEVLAEAQRPGDPPLRQLIVQLWSLRTDERPSHEVDLSAAQRVGILASEAGDEEAALVRRILDAGQGMLERGLGSGALDLAGALRLGGLVNEAAVRAVAALARARHDRREAWLSCLTHDLKNPLNTILNALWLIREHRAGGNIERFLDLAERAVRRMEGGIRDVRDLHEKVRQPPRGREDTPLPTPLPER